MLRRAISYWESPIYYGATAFYSLLSHSLYILSDLCVSADMVNAWFWLLMWLIDLVDMQLDYLDSVIMLVGDVMHCAVCVVRELESVLPTVHAL